jgi:hypothetical protein
MGCKGSEVQILSPRQEPSFTLRMAVFMFPQTKTMIMNPLHLQNLGSWESLDMVEHYAQLEHIDLLREHKAHPPVDSLSNGS